MVLPSLIPLPHEHRDELRTSREVSAGLAGALHATVESSEPPAVMAPPAVAPPAVSGFRRSRTHVARHSGRHHKGVCAWTSLDTSSMRLWWRDAASGRWPPT